MKYLPLFHHFKAIDQFPKHIILLVKIVAKAALTMTTRISIMVLLIRETSVFYGNWCWFASEKSLKIPMGQSEPEGKTMQWSKENEQRDKQ